MNVTAITPLKPAPRSFELPAMSEATSTGVTPANATTVPYNPDEAKTKLKEADIPYLIARRILSVGSKRPTIMAALADLVSSGVAAKAVANRHRINPSTIHYWAHRVGLPARQRGRRALLEPSEQHARILALVRRDGVAAAARGAGKSRQYVFQLVCRWRPELRGRRKVARLKPAQKRKRQAPRNIVVSFRLSTDEWQRLRATSLPGGGHHVSDFGKARAIVLKHISAARR